jgi:hypothetical protein
LVLIGTGDEGRGTEEMHRPTTHAPRPVS